MFNNISKVLLVLTLLIFVIYSLNCCRHSQRTAAIATPDMLSLTGTINYEIYDKGNISKKGVLTSGSAISRQLQSQLRSLDGKWIDSDVTFAPKIKFSVPTGSIMIQNRQIVVNYTESNQRYRQVVAPIPSNVCDELIEKLSNHTP